MLDRLHRGDPEAAFAVAAASEAYKREVQRWSDLSELLADHGQAICETIADAMSV